MIWKGSSRRVETWSETHFTNSIGNEAKWKKKEEDLLGYWNWQLKMNQVENFNPVSNVHAKVNDNYQSEYIPCEN